MALEVALAGSALRVCDDGMRLGKPSSNLVVDDRQRVEDPDVWHRDHRMRIDLSDFHGRDFNP